MLKANKTKNKNQKSVRNGGSLGFLSKSWSLADPMCQSRLWVPDDQVHRFVRTTESLGAFASSASVPVYGNIYFAHTNFVNYANFTTLFDQYRIVEGEVWLIPRVGTGSATGTNYGLFTSCIDYDDATNLTSIGDGLGHTNSITTSGSQGHYHKFKPRPALAAYTGTFTGYANPSDSLWMDCASSSIQYYGVKYAITVTDAVYAFDAILKMVIEFRNLRT
jgi:hypothetical protein